MSKGNLAIVTKQAFSLHNFRSAFIRDLTSCGWTVYCLAPDFTEETRGIITALGAIPVDYPLDPLGTNPVADLRSIRQLTRVFKELRITVVVAFFLKPVLYASLAARLNAGIRFVAIIEGLGYLFNPRLSWRDTPRVFMRECVVLLYRLALQNARVIFFSNHDDVAYLVGRGVVANERCHVTAGIGVDLQHFKRARPYRPSPVTFVLVARLLVSKGVVLFLDAAEMIKARFPDVRCLVVGAPDTNPDAVDARELEAYRRRGLVEFTGQVRDVRLALEDASVFVLPSYYREGLPRSIQEALAMSVPVITTDAPGCRHAIRDGVNGSLIPPRDLAALVDAMTVFITAEPGFLTTMSCNARRFAERTYDVRAINQEIISRLDS